MTHNSVYRRFKEILPDIAKDTVAWFGNGKDSIRVRLTDGEDYIFTLTGRDTWTYENLDSFIERLNKSRAS